MGTRKWSVTTARVLNRLRKVSNEILDGQPTEYERACVNRVWPFVGVERREYPANGLWENIKPQDRRDSVRRQLETRFSEGAFAREGKTARDAFTPDDLLAWGDQLYAAEAAADATVAAADAYDSLGDHGKARDAYERSLPIYLLAYHSDHPVVAGTLTNLGCTYSKLGDHAKARDVLKRALPILEFACGRDDAIVAKTLTNLGLAYGNLGDHAKKRDMLKRALPIYEGEHGKESIEVTQTLTELGSAYGDLGDYAKQREVLERALPIFVLEYGKDSTEVVNMLFSLGRACNKLGDYAKERDMLERTLPYLVRENGSDHVTVVLVRKTLVELEKEHGLDHPKVGSALENVTNADLMREDIGSWACSGSVENVAKCSWKSRSRDGSSRGGDRRSRLPSDSASLDQFGMELDSESLLSEVLSMMSL